ncbi:MAG: hypothetical protein E7397_04490 [Ruminococcaceae bacterium]|nr:hypothetical protein [Oscillospiraceae bacterium]
MKKILAMGLITAITAGSMPAVLAQSKDMTQYITGFEKIRTETLPELDALIRECEEKKIFVDYEKADYRVIEKFIDFGLSDATGEHLTAKERNVPFSYAVGYGNEDIPTDKTARAIYIYEALVDIASDTKEKLEGYLDKSIVPAGEIDKYVTSDVSVDGYFFVATNESGEKKPVIFTGYGHFGETVGDLPIFSDMGVNVIQVEVGPAFIMKLDENGNPCINQESEYLRDLLAAFDKAAENNVSIALLLSPHYFFNGNLGEENYAGYFSSTQEVKDLLRVYYKGIMEAVKDKPALHSVCLANEPNYTAMNETYDLPLFREFLKERYQGDIAALNQNYQTEYATFDEVKFPETDLIYEPEGNEDKLSAILDFIDFNDQYFASVFEDFYSYVKEVIPDIPAGVKIMENWDMNERDWRRGFILYGTNVEEMGKVMTVNGNDANNYYDPQDYEWTLLSKLAHYDIQASVNKAPVFDYEGHVIRDRNDTYGSWEMVNHVGADVWEGAVHDRGGVTLWVWERSYDDSHDFSGSIINRPDVVAGTSKTMLDIHRLTDEVTALQNTEKRIGIYYSRTPRLYSKYYSNSLYKAYEAASYTGERVDFVTDAQMAEGKLLNSDIEVLLVPYATHADKGTAEAIRDFIANGGKVVLMDEACLSYDQYNRPVDSAVKDAILTGSTVLTTKKEVVDQIAEPTEATMQEALMSLLDTPILVTDTATGKPVYGVMMTYAEEDGALIVDFCNTDWDATKTVQISLNGTPITTGVELRSMQDVNLQSLEIKPYDPLLVRIENGVFADSKAHWANQDIMGLWKYNAIESGSSYAPEQAITVGDFAELAERVTGVSASVLTSGKEITAELKRAEMAELLTVICAEKKIEMTTGDISTFADCDGTSEAISKVVGTGLMAGKSETIFDPDAIATKAEAAAVISRIAKR